jgi:hypothetical protein
VEVDVKVVDAPLDYNLLLGHNWTYAMTTIVSFVFYTLCFSHDGNIVTIDQFPFTYASPNASVGLSIPMVDNSQLKIENISVRMYSPLMGTFNFMALIHHIYAMSSRYTSSTRVVPFHTSYFNDPWALPSSTTSCEGQPHTRMAMPLSAVEIAYQVVHDSYVNSDPVTVQTDEEDIFLKLIWATSLYFSRDLLNDTLPLYEKILEAMNGSDRPWNDMHHRSYFLPDLARIEQDDFRSTLREIIGHAVYPLDTHDIYVEGNMVRVSLIGTIYISRIPSKVENVYIGVDCSS